MDRRGYDDICEVSKYWTPEHLDVTHVPFTYARPKATWIDGFQRLRPRLASDFTERMLRRSVHNHAIVDPAEITVAPPLVLAEDGEHERRKRS